MEPWSIPTLVCSVVQNQEHVSDAEHEDNLCNWHMRFGHQTYGTIEGLAEKPGSGFTLTNLERPNCMKESRPKTGYPRRTAVKIPLLTGAGGVKCSDLRVSITPVDSEKTDIW